MVLSEKHSRDRKLELFHDFYSQKTSRITSKISNIAAKSTLIPKSVPVRDRMICTFIV